MYLTQSTGLGMSRARSRQAFGALAHTRSPCTQEQHRRDCGTSSYCSQWSVSGSEGKVRPSTWIHTSSPSPDGSSKGTLVVGNGDQTCELQNLIIKVGHSLIMHDLASDDKLQASLGQELTNLGTVGGKEKAGHNPRAWEALQGHAYSVPRCLP